MDFRFASAAIGAVSLVLASQSQADPIKFTDSLLASGKIGSSSFNNALVIISGTADTANVAPWPSNPSLLLSFNTSASVTIGSLGTYSFSSETSFYVDNTSGSVFFGRGENGDLIAGPTLSAPWDMTTSVGPVTGDGAISQWAAPYEPVLTDGGQLILEDASPLPVTFSAEVAEVPLQPELPNPSDFVFLETPPQAGQPGYYTMINDSTDYFIADFFITNPQAGNPYQPWTTQPNWDATVCEACFSESAFEYFATSPFPSIGDYLAPGTRSSLFFFDTIPASVAILDLVDANGDAFRISLGAPAPEPATWAMMLLGFAGLGYAGYRRRWRPQAKTIGV